MDEVENKPITPRVPVPLRFRDVLENQDLGLKGATEVVRNKVVRLPDAVATRYLGITTSTICSH